MDVLKALAICGGGARRPALARLGIDDAALRRAVRAGVLQPHRGLYALPTAAPDHVALLQHRQLLTCSSAAPFYRLWSVQSAGPAHVDLLLEGRLVVELDGRHHGEWTQVKKDQRRNNGSVVRGYSVLRYYYEDVVHHPELMLAEVQAVLAGASSSGAG